MSERSISTDDLAALDRTTRAIVRGAQADEERRGIIRRLWEAGLTQRELADRITRASQAVGGEPFTENAVFKSLRRMRRREGAA